MIGMPLHGVFAVVGELGVKPLVQRSHKGGVSGLVSQLASALYVFVVDGDLTRLCSSEIGEPWHILAMNM